MEIRAVKKQIQGGQLDRLYLFTGDEIEAQRIYINKIAEVTGRTIKRVDTVADALKDKPAGLIKRPTLYVVRDDKDFMQTEKAWHAVADLLVDKMLIIQLTEIDKRKKFYKHFAEQIVTFNYMDTDVLYKYVQKEVELSDSNTEQLIHICGCSYGRILLEADKIRQYAESMAVAHDVTFEKLVSEGAIFRPPEDAIFDFVDAVLQAKPQRAYRLLEECKAIGEPSLRLVSVLYSNIKRVLQVQICNSSDVSKTTGLSAWDVKCARRNVGFWRGEDLVSFMRTLQKVERGIKTGEIDDAVAVDFALSHIF